MRPQELVREVADAYGITTEDIRSRSRVARIADARAVACYLLARRLGMSTTCAGREVLRDHTSAMHNIRKVESFYLWPRMYAADLAIIEDIDERFFNKSNTEPTEKS